MKTLSEVSSSWLLARIGIGAVVFAALLAAAAGWWMNGTAILFTYAQEGLAWCF